jgi:hypothetical protein
VIVVVRMTDGSRTGMALFTRVLGLTGEEADRICNGCVKACYDKKAHIYTFL